VARPRARRWASCRGQSRPRGRRPSATAGQEGPRPASLGQEPRCMPASLLGRSRPRGLGLPARTGSLGQDFRAKIRRAAIYILSRARRLRPRIIAAFPPIGALGDVTPVGRGTPKAPGQPYVVVCPPSNPTYTGTSTPLVAMATMKDKRARPRVDRARRSVINGTYQWDGRRGRAEGLLL